MQARSWLYLFWAVVVVHLVGTGIEHRLIIMASKPLLMIFLTTYLVQSTKLGSSFLKWIAGGFVFSFFGDVLLMFVENNEGGELYFTLGLGSFLIAHFCYLRAFLEVPLAKTKGFLRQNPWLFLVFVLFWFGNVWFLWADIPDDLKIPVAVYSAMIVAMAAACLNTKTLLPAPIFWLLFIGVLLFVVSDTCIGINKFKTAQIALPYPRLLIMSTYIASQYLIARGSIRHHVYGWF